MTQEDKELLLTNLCARLPYGVICQFIWTYSNETTDGESVIAKEDDDIRSIDIHTKEIQANYYGEWVDLEHCKPYLRPLSSMTEEEYDQLYIDSRVKEDSIDILDALANDMDAIDWLNAHHFDYRGLIEKGLALKAPEDMYKL